MSMVEVVGFRGWKTGELLATTTAFLLRSGTMGINFGINDEACCYRDPFHRPPQASCTCGFYAYGKIEQLALYARFPFSQLLQVELSGRLLRSGTSCRAERQRVLRLLLNPWCVCGARAGGVGRLTQDSSHGHHMHEPTPLMSQCKNCAGAEWWQPADVQRGLQVDTAWAGPEEAVALLGANGCEPDH